ncbi:sugar O-acetyltransferase [Gelidibacter salicanalis]|uniref:Acetyltransferase n=1 Tax=Gelidibacter salicanalis TaxID=291193 RepID=A0A934NIQ1_9FLAO|nr:sugar O-acetyltransferase [Gelidibacter salicanalis]MBJ7880334.1 sugar O-acetyltransferase [Gelidibacter salicanalis]
MKSEKEKMIAGEIYAPADPQLIADRRRSRLLFGTYNQSHPDEIEHRKAVLEELFESPTENLYIEPPFYCDYGYNIQLGANVYMNFNCCILDVSLVTIGDNTMLGPNVQIYTATHPLEYKARNSGVEYAKPIVIGQNVWIGGNATICPGVTLGNNVVVGAGSVVTKCFPDDVVVAGNPAKIIKTINNQ